MVRRGGHYFVKNDLSTGVASSDFFYGDPGDVLLAGRWSADQIGDTLGVRRGGTYYLRHSLTSGPADRVLAYGEPTDTAFSGDWNGDGLDSLGVRRASAPPTSVRNSGFGDGVYEVGTQIAPGTYRTGGTADACYWERLSGFGDTLDDVITSGFGGPEIVTIEATDAGFRSEDCVHWQPLEATYPPAPLTVFGEGRTRSERTSRRARTRRAILMDPVTTGTGCPTSCTSPSTASSTAPWVPGSSRSRPRTPGSPVLAAGPGPQCHSCPMDGLPGVRRRAQTRRRSR
jgi:hypothetical protein